jgi:hypothetical protein
MIWEALHLHHRLCMVEEALTCQERPCNTRTPLPRPMVCPKVRLAVRLKAHLKVYLKVYLPCLVHFQIRCICHQVARGTFLVDQ